MARKNYTVLVAYHKGAGHWQPKGSTVDLLDIEAFALRQAGRIRLTSEIEAEAAAQAAETAKAGKATAKGAE